MRNVLTLVAGIALLSMSQQQAASEVAADGSSKCPGATFAEAAAMAANDPQKKMVDCICKKVNPPAGSPAGTKPTFPFLDCLPQDVRAALEKMKANKCARVASKADVIAHVTPGAEAVAKRLNRGAPLSAAQKTRLAAWISRRACGIGGAAHDTSRCLFLNAGNPKAMVGPAVMVTAFKKAVIIEETRHVAQIGKVRCSGSDLDWLMDAYKEVEAKRGTPDALADAYNSVMASGSTAEKKQAKETFDALMTDYGHFISSMCSDIDLLNSNWKISGPPAVKPKDRTKKENKLVDIWEDYNKCKNAALKEYQDARIKVGAGNTSVPEKPEPSKAR